MYIYISEDLLQDQALSGSEKIVAAFIKLLTEKKKNYFGGAGWITKNFGLQDAASVLLNLDEKGYIKETPGGFIFLGKPKSSENSDYDISVRTMDEVQADCIKWLEAGYEQIKETESQITFSNMKNTAIVRKFK
jgi:hypothetical protein